MIFAFCVYAALGNSRSSASSKAIKSDTLGKRSRGDLKNSTPYSGFYSCLLGKGWWDYGTMRAFKIYLNGKKLCVAGLEQGDLLFSISGGENRHGRSGVGLGMTGLLPTKSTIRWQQRSLQMNDRVQIKIVESKTADKFEVLQDPPPDARKYEKAYVRRMAKEFGWTIQAKPRKSQSSN